MLITSFAYMQMRWDFTLFCIYANEVKGGIFCDFNLISIYANQLFYIYAT